MIDSRYSEAEQKATALGVYDSPCCCLDPQFTLKARKLFGSADAMYNSSSLKGALFEWGNSSRHTNLGSECILAEVKHAAPGHAPLLERVCSAGFMTQLVSEHVTLGRQDPRFDSVDSALKAGTPLICAEDRRQNPKTTRGFLSYANDMLRCEARDREQQGLSKLPKTERDLILQAGARELSSLPDQARFPHVTKS